MLTPKHLLRISAIGSATFQVILSRFLLRFRPNRQATISGSRREPS